MQYTCPDYYREFHCTADACEDTCCAGWQIVVDKKSLKKYSRERGPYRWKLWKSINWFQSTFRQSKDLRCAFLKEDNFCEMYQNLGEKSLCKTCRTYPRHIEEFEAVRELTLSLSCPEVAKILMNRTEPVQFLSVESEREGEDEYDNFDPFLYSLLADTRDVLIQILQNRKLSIPVRTQLMLGIAHDMQKRINEENLFACYEVLEKYQTPKAVAFVENDLKNQTIESEYQLAKHAVEQMEQMELLRKDWFFVLEEAKKNLYSIKEKTSVTNIQENVAHWQFISEEFHIYMKNSKYQCDTQDTENSIDKKNKHNLKEINHDLPTWEIQKEQLLVYFISTYFCGAAYDGRVLAKAELAATSVLIIEELLKNIWLRNEKIIDTQDVVELVYRFSREIEHSDENLQKLMSAEIYF